MTSQKEKDVLSNVLELYKDMPNLWNKTHQEYKNKQLRHDGFCVLLEVYKNFDSEATIKTIKRKIDNMRTNYQKEAKKVDASKHTGASSENVYVPSLWYFEALTFLGSTTEACRPVRDSVGNIVSNEDSSSSEAGKSQASAPCKKKKRSILQKQENVINSVEKLLSTKDEEWEVLGRSIGFQLRDLERRQLAIAQKLIGDVIFYAKMGRITEDTHITLGSMTYSPSLSNTTDNSSSSSSYMNNNRIKYPYQHRIQSPHPSPVYHNPSPQYRVQSPHPSPVYYSQNSVQSPQYHIQSPEPSSRQPVQAHQTSSVLNLQEFGPPQIEIPEYDSTQPQYEIQLPTQTDANSYTQTSSTAQCESQSSSPSHPSQNDATSHRQIRKSNKIDIQEYLILKKK